VRQLWMAAPGDRVRIITGEADSRQVPQHGKGGGMTHADLIVRAERWLRNTLHCRVILTELTAYTRSGETPDAIGWVRGHCILVECKSSRADFRADQRKPSRPRALFPALGNWRFYMTPPGLLDGLTLPDGWGWYEVRGRRVWHAGGMKYRNASSYPLASDAPSEIAMLISALSRKGADDGR